MQCLGIVDHPLSVRLAVSDSFRPFRENTHGIRDLFAQHPISGCCVSEGGLMERPSNVRPDQRAQAEVLNLMEARVVELAEPFDKVRRVEVITVVSVRTAKHE